MLKQKCDLSEKEIKQYNIDLETEIDPEPKPFDEENADFEKFLPVVDELTASYLEYLRGYNQTLKERIDFLSQSKAKIN
jgi:hypothetical protein